MKSYYEGRGIGDTCLHMIQYFDGWKIREISVVTLNSKITWVERSIHEILEPGINYRTAKRRLAALEKKATQRIG